MIIPAWFQEDGFTLADCNMLVKFFKLSCDTVFFLCSTKLSQISYRLHHVEPHSTCRMWNSAGGPFFVLLYFLKRKGYFCENHVCVCVWCVCGVCVWCVCVCVCVCGTVQRLVPTNWKGCRLKPCRNNLRSGHEMCFVGWCINCKHVYGVSNRQ